MEVPVVAFVHPIGLGAVWPWHAEMPLRRLVQLEDALYEVRRQWFMNLIREHLQ